MLSDFYPDFKGWTEVTPAAAAGQRPQIPDPTTQVNPYLRAPLPLALTYQPDVLRQSNRPGLSTFRIAPQSPSSFPAVNAAAAGVAKSTVSTATVAAINANPPSSGGSTDTDIITGTNRQLFGSLDSFGTTSLSTGAGGAATLNGISITGTASGANELAVVTAVGVTNAGASTLGQSPGVGWTATPSIINGYSMVVPAGSLTVGQGVVSSCFNIAQALAFFKTNGSVPVLTLRASQSGGTTVTSSAFTPAAGNSLLWIVTTAGTANTQSTPSVTDTAGLSWTQISNVFVGTITAGTPHNVNIVMYYAQNVPNASMTSTLNIPGIGGNWTLYEISNVGNVSSGAYTFQTTDANKLVQFAGGANITGTLPNPALVAGWQAVVSNNGPGTVTLTSATFINQGSRGVILPPGGSTWVFSDGTNYWTSTTVLPQAIAKAASKWLDSYNPFLGAFTQSQPAASDLSNGTTGSGAVVLAGSPTITGTAALPIATLTGKITNYNSIVTVDGGVPAEYAKVDLTAQAAAIAATNLYAIPAAGVGMYRISWVATVTQAATTSSILGGTNGFQIVYTDADDSAVKTSPAPGAPSAGVNQAYSQTNQGNTTATQISGVIVVRAKASTNIQYKMDYASVGATAMNFNLHIKLEAL